MNKIKLKNIYLATQNPRMETIGYNDVNGDFFRNHQKNDDCKLMKKIIKHEGNLSNLLELFKSLSNNYDSMLGAPYLIDSNDFDKKIVIEGNRRILVLKCLNKLIDFIKLEDIEQFIDDEIQNDLYKEDIENNNNQRKNNYSQIQKIIKNYNKQIETINVELIEKNEQENKKIAIAIFTNHVTGNKKGKRNWDRGKTLQMYKNFLDTIDIQDIKKKIMKISELINRSESDVKANLCSANLIMFLLKKSNKNIDDFVRTNSVSGLEIQFIKKFINFENKNRWNNYIQYNKSCEYKENILLIKESNLNKNLEEMCKFIIDSLEKKYFNTRGINSKKQNEICQKLSIFFEESQNINSNDFNKDLSNIQDINTKKILDNLNKFKDPNIIEYGKIITTTKKFDDIIQTKKLLIFPNSPFDNNKNLKPFKITLSKLVNQYHLLLQNDRFFKNKLKEYPINGIMCTLRSMIENFCYILMFDENILNLFKKNKKYYSYFWNKKNINFGKENFEDIFLNTKINYLHTVYKFFRNEIQYNNNFEILITKALQKITNNKSIEKIDNFKNIFTEKYFVNSSKLIHTPHLFELDNSNLKQIFQNCNNFLNEIMKFFEKLKLIKKDI